MIKYVLLSLGLIAGSCFGATTYKSITVNHKSGETVGINLKKNLKVSCQQDSLVVTGATYGFAFALADIKGWTHNTEEQEEVDPNPPSGIVNVDADKGGLELTDDYVVLSGLPANSNVALYAVNGDTVAARVSVSGTHTIALNTLAPGVYILSVNGKTTKILVK